MGACTLCCTVWSDYRRRSLVIYVKIRVPFLEQSLYVGEEREVHIMC